MCIPGYHHVSAYIGVYRLMDLLPGITRVEVKVEQYQYWQFHHLTWTMITGTAGELTVFEKQQALESWFKDGREEDVSVRWRQ